MLSQDMKGKIKKASYLYHMLLKNGEMNLQEEDGTGDYQDEVVRELLEMMASDAESYVFKVGEMLYMIPEAGNNFLGYSNEEIKNSMLGTAYKAADLYIGYYAMLCYLSKVYEGEGYNPRTADSMSIENLVKTIDERLKPYYKGEDEEGDGSSAQQIDATLKFNITAVAKRWNELETFKDRKDIKKQKSKIGYVERTFSFFEKHGLVTFTNRNKDITPTRKLDEIVKHYYTYPGREVQLIKLFGEEADNE